MNLGYNVHLNEGGIIVRVDGRKLIQLRPIHIETNYLKHPEGSVLISVGDTKVICSASIEDRVPPFHEGGRKRLDYRRIFHAPTSY